MPREEELEVQDGPDTELPETRESIRAGAMAEGETDAVLEDLASLAREITATDLRRLPGTEKMSDDELLKMWKDQSKDEAGTEDKPKLGPDGKPVGEVPPPPPVKRNYKIYDDKGVEVTDLSKMSAEQMLKATYGYSAMNKEQKKTFDEVIRNASLGHLNEQKLTTLQAERNAAYEKLQKLTEEHGAWGNDRQKMTKALEALARGDDKPIKALAAAYQQALLAEPEAGNDAQAQLELELAGQRYYYEHIIPRGYDIATQYGAKPQEVVNAIKHYIEQEPAELLTEAKIQSIIDYEIPALLERNGYSRTGEAAQVTPPAGSDPRDKQFKDMQDKIAELTAKIENAATDAVRKKTKLAPPPGGGTTGGAGDAQPSFKNRAEMKAWLQKSGE